LNAAETTPIEMTDEEKQRMTKIVDEAKSKGNWYSERMQGLVDH
jgi:hypothetical protein